jgi:hypothetical protein
MIITESYLIVEPVFHLIRFSSRSRGRYSIVLLFNTNRLNRLVEFQAENNGLGIDDMINILSSKTWKAPRLKGFKS